MAPREEERKKQMKVFDMTKEDFAKVRYINTVSEWDEIAKDNKLNYKAFYSVEDFNTWIESFKTLEENNEKTI